MHFKKIIQQQVYHLYLCGYSLSMIACIAEIDEEDVDEIIDYLNERYEV